MKKIFLGLFILINIIICNRVLAFKEYQLGDEVNYKGEDYYVISYSDENTNYVTLLKKKSLTVDELYKYGRDESGKLFVNKDLINSDDPEKVIYEFEDNSGGIAFYSDDQCRTEYSWNTSGFNLSDDINLGCINKYESSDIKKVVDNWTNDKISISDLIEIEGYKTRILNRRDIYISLGPVSYDYGDYNLRDKEWFSDLTLSVPLWTMSRTGNNSFEIEIIYYGSINKKNVFYISAVKPVINLKKCAIEDGCTEELIEKESENIEEDADKSNIDVKNNSNDESQIIVDPEERIEKQPDNIIIETKVEPEKEKTIIEAENTFKTVSYVLIIMGSLLIIGGYIFYKKIKKINN